MKILCLADPHMTSTNLGVRKDFFPDTIFNKVKATLDLAAELKVDLYEVVGDFFHNKGISYGYMNRVAELFKQYQGRSFSMGCVPGNHCEINEDPASIPRTPLGNMFVNGIFTPKMGQYVTEYSDCICVSMPFMAHPSAFAVPNPENKKLVLFTHYFLESKFAEDEVLPKELTEVFDYIFTGHDHDTYPPVKVGKALVIRPGALSRGTRHRSNWDRAVQVAYLDTDTGECKYIPISCAPAADVFNVEGLDIQKKVAEVRDISQLSQGVDVNQAANVGSLLESYKLREDLLKRTKELLAEAGIQ